MERLFPEELSFEGLVESFYLTVLLRAIRGIEDNSYTKRFTVVSESLAVAVINSDTSNVERNTSY